MKKKWLSFVLSVFLSMIAISVWLIANPIPAFASSCCARCPGRLSMCCFGDTCQARDGIGCQSNNGGTIYENLCINSPVDPFLD